MSESAPATSPARAALATVADEPRTGGWYAFARFVGQRPAFLAGLVIVGLTVFLAAVGPYIGPYPTETALPGDPLQPPSLRHPFGTDVSNMDIFSRVIAAPRIDLTIALVSTGIAFVFGVLLGVISGFFGGGQRRLARYASEGIMRAADIVQAFPVFIFALALVGFRGPGAVNVIAALAFLNIPLLPSHHARRGAPGTRAPVHRGGAVRWQLGVADRLLPRAAERADPARGQHLADHRVLHPADVGAQLRRRRRARPHPRSGAR